MIVIPAIDIINGNAVRLYKGDYSKEEVISSDIIGLAKGFEKAGAKFLHLVDLDGAKKGEVVNISIIEEIVRSIKTPVEVGGGVRSMESIDKLINIGVKRVILGTSAIKDKELLLKSVEKYGEKIAVGVDFKGNKVCTNGWLEKSDKTYMEFCKELADIGVQNIIITDISKDGTLEGSNTECLRELSKVSGIKITASGGVKDINDIKKINEIGVYGVITGKAIYSKTLDLNEAIKLTNIK